MAEDLTSNLIKKHFYREAINAHMRKLVSIHREIQSLPYWRWVYMIILHRKYKKVTAEMEQLTKEMRQL